MDDAIEKLDKLLHDTGVCLQLWFEDGEYFADYDDEIIRANSLSALIEEVLR